MAPGGYLDRRILYYNTDPKNSIRNGHGLTIWDNRGDVLANYSLSYLFGQYLSLQAQSGQAIFKNILDYMLAHSVFDYTAVLGVAKQHIAGINSWEDLLKSWAIANMANEPDGTYGYKGQFILTPHGPAGFQTSLHNSGTVYRTIAGAVETPSGAGADMRYYAVLNSTITALPASSGGLCAASFVADNDTSALSVIRSFRDRVLTTTPAGMDYIQLFYKHSLELTLLFMSDSSLKAQGEKLLYDVIPYLVSIRNGNVITINPFIIDEISFLCDSLSASASPALLETLFQFQHELHDGTVCNKLAIRCVNN
jgi:hypothetical protein